MNLRDVIGRISHAAGKRGLVRSARKVLLGGVAESRKGKLQATIGAMHLGDPSTWRAGEPTDCILDWPTTLELAGAHAPLPEWAERLAGAVDTGSPEIAP